MPVQPDPRNVQIMPLQVQVPVVEGMFISLSIQSDGTATEELLNTTLQSLVDHLQQWPGRHPEIDVTGNDYRTMLYTVTPTNPIIPAEDDEPAFPFPEDEPVEP